MIEGFYWAPNLVSFGRDCSVKTNDVKDTRGVNWYGLGRSIVLICILFLLLTNYFTCILFLSYNKTVANK